MLYRRESTVIINHVFILFQTKVWIRPHENSNSYQEVQTHTNTWVADTNSKRCIYLSVSFPARAAVAASSVRAGGAYLPL